MVSSTRAVVQLAVVASMAVLMVAVSPQYAKGAVGDTLRVIQASLPCGVSTSVAAVPGHRVGRPEPVLLAISCHTTDAALAPVIHFIDPAESPVGDPQLTAVNVLAAQNRTVKTITTKNANGTTFVPPVGWGSLAYRADVGDFIGCATHPSGQANKIYAIDVNFHNTVPDGQVTFLFDQPVLNNGTPCDGIAWDPSDDTIYTGPDQSFTIYHFGQNANGAWQQVSDHPQGFASPTITLGPNANQQCRKSGLALVGGTLFIACNGQNSLFMVSKTDPTEVLHEFLPANLPSGTQLRTEDLECDAVTFAAQSKDALWTKDAGGGEIFAFEIPAGTCGLPTGPPVLHPAACRLTTDSDGDGILDVDPSQPDTDGDALLDCWEDPAKWADNIPGIDYDGDGVRDIALCVTNVNGASECADKLVKDIFVEFDSMVNQPAHLAALNQVVLAFANAPVDNTGIRLHIQVDEQNVPFAQNTALPPCTPPPGPGHANFDTLKATHFGTVAERTVGTPPPTAPGLTSYDAVQREKTLFAKRIAFHYGVSVAELTRLSGSSPSGCAELPGNDFIISLGGFGGGNGTQDQWAGTFMHELGHNLGLHHGGGDRNNCKGNYLSVMNYAFQFSNIVTDRRLDYSDRVLAPLDETAGPDGIGLDEPTPALGPLAATLPLSATGQLPRTAYGGGSGAARMGFATGALRWNTDTDVLDLDVTANVNRIGNTTGCEIGAGGGLIRSGLNDIPDGSPPLTGFDDWANLVYNFRASFDFADGHHDSTDPAFTGGEMDPDQEQEFAELADADADDVPDLMACAGAPCTIDVVPGLANNPVVLLNHNGVPKAIVPVAILSHATFDATTVLRPTVKLNATPVQTVFGRPACIVADVNNDTLKDLVCTFVLTGVSLGFETALVEAQAFVGGKAVAIRGGDFMNIVPLPRRSGDDDD